MDVINPGPAAALPQEFFATFRILYNVRRLEVNHDRTPPLPPHGGSIVIRPLLTDRGSMPHLRVLFVFGEPDFVIGADQS
jgi:hypothetical protein